MSVLKYSVRYTTLDAYKNNDFLKFGMFLNPPSNEWMQNMVTNLSYVKVYNGEINTNNTETEEVCNKIFNLFNGDDNPLSTQSKQNFIRENNTHTSMSIGDIIYINDGYYICRTMGFSKLNIKFN